MFKKLRHFPIDIEQNQQYCLEWIKSGFSKSDKNAWNQKRMALPPLNPISYFVHHFV